MKNKYDQAIEALNILIKLRGKDSPLPFVIDKHIRLTKFLLSLWKGEIIYFLVIFIMRLKEVKVFRRKKNKENKRSFPDSIILMNQWNFKTIVRRFSYSIIYMRILDCYFLADRISVINKYLAVNFLWYFIAIQDSNIQKNKEIFLNLDFSPADAALLASIGPKTHRAIIAPAFTKLSDKYYSIINSISDEFIMVRDADYLPKKIRGQKYKNKKNYNFNPIKIKKKFPIVIILALTTFKKNPSLRIPIVTKALVDLRKKYGHNVKYILRPHPYEYLIFACSNKIRDLGVKVSLDDKDLKNANLCITAGTSLIYEMSLSGIPFFFVREIDPYYPDCYNIFKCPLLYSFDCIDDLPGFNEIFASNEMQNHLKEIQQLVVGNFDKK